MTTNDLLKIFGGVFGTVLIAFIGNVFGWIRFGRKDTAETRKINIDSEVALSRQALEWTVEFKARLDRQTEQLDQLQDECDVLKQEKMLAVAHIDTLQGHCDKLKEENENLKRENEEMKKKLERYIKKYGHD